MRCRKVAPGGSKYMDLYHQAMAIWIPELPTIPTVQWYQICPNNTAYWKGWPNEENPYTTPAELAPRRGRALHRRARTRLNRARGGGAPAPQRLSGGTRHAHRLSYSGASASSSWCCGGPPASTSCCRAWHPGNPVRERLISQATAGRPHARGHRGDGARVQHRVRPGQAALGAIRPLHVPLVQFDFGYSITNYPAKVLPLIQAALPWTIGLLAVSSLIAFGLGTLLGALMGWPAPRASSITSAGR